LYAIAVQPILHSGVCCFVAQVLASVMHTASFAYLGLFLFNDTINLSTCWSARSSQFCFIWDNVTKTGSKYKAELNAMTSSSIIFTLFVFGTLTYLAVKHGTDPGLDGPVVGSNLTHRLWSEPLDSDDEGQTQAELVSTPEPLEIEHHGMGARQHTFNHAGSHVSSRGPRRNSISPFQ
jgi:hypothetical protein